jgi:hypothetical protein
MMGGFVSTSLFGHQSPSTARVVEKMEKDCFGMIGKTDIEGQDGYRMMHEIGVYWVLAAVSYVQSRRI